MFVHLPTTNVPKLQRTDIKGKRWYVTPDGDYLPSITTVLGNDDSKKEWLQNWRNSLGPKKADSEAKRAADRGTAIHDMVEKFLKNNETPTAGHDHEHTKLFNQIKLVLKKINNIRLQEASLFSTQLEVAGTCDCIAEYDGVLSVIDFKTSNNNKTSEMIQDYYLQATAYSIMYEELFKEKIQQIVILIAVEKGLMPLVFKGDPTEYTSALKTRINNFYDSLQ